MSVYLTACLAAFLSGFLADKQCCIGLWYKFYPVCANKSSTLSARATLVRHALLLGKGGEIERERESEIWVKEVVWRRERDWIECVWPLPVPTADTHVGGEPGRATGRQYCQVEVLVNVKELQTWTAHYYWADALLFHSWSPLFECSEVGICPVPNMERRGGGEGGGQTTQIIADNYWSGHRFWLSTGR